MTLALTLNIALAALTFVAVIGGIWWSIATQHREHIGARIAEGRVRLATIPPPARRSVTQRPVRRTYLAS